MVKLNGACFTELAGQCFPSIQQQFCKSKQEKEKATTVARNKTLAKLLRYQKRHNLKLKRAARNGQQNSK